MSLNFADIKNILSNLSDPIERLEMVMDFGRQISSVPDTAVCTEIKGCSSFVQICRDGDMFYGVADSEMVRGIVAIIISMVQGRSPDQIKEMDLAAQFLSLDLKLGASRLNGVNSMLGFLENL